MVLFSDMEQALIEDIFNMIVVKRIINYFSFLAVFNKPGLFQHSELMRNRGFGHSQEYRDIANAHL